MRVTGDIVGDIVDAFRDCGVGETICARIERAGRNNYGREQVYVLVNRPGETRTKLQLMLVNPAAPIAQEARRLGLGRGTISRYLRRVSRS